MLRRQPQRHVFVFRKLQLNLIRSHATGYGKHLEPSKARMLLALRINVFAKGHSGISLENIEKLVKAFNGQFLIAI